MDTTKANVRCVSCSKPTHIYTHKCSIADGTNEREKSTVQLQIEKKNIAFIQPWNQQISILKIKSLAYYDFDAYDLVFALNKITNWKEKKRKIMSNLNRLCSARNCCPLSGTETLTKQIRGARFVLFENWWHCISNGILFATPLRLLRWEPKHYLVLDT